ncbi:GNAT family N-acetyltransferase [Plantactinospora sp. B24E8]|uniref:GNAT family N-acetyltransferase n=1 Tax=Plantactinospora sp. B24E8 TaxID=3153567 RepID=UPI00325D7030
MTIRIRRVERADAARVAELLGQLGYPTTAAEAEERLDCWSDDPASLLLGADADGLLVGVAALHVTPLLELTGRFGRLVALVVDERCRGTGVGRTLVEEIERQARQAGCLFMEVTSSRHRDAAHRFYQGLGYQETSARKARFTRFLSAPAAPGGAGPERK